jgi:hypothetical protein
MLIFQVRQQNDTLLFVWISPRDEGDATFRVARIVGLMGHIGGDVKEVASSSDEMFFQSLAVPHPGFAAEDVNGSFMLLVLMHLGSSAAWNYRDLQIDCLCAHGLGRDSRRQKVSLLAHERGCCANDSAPRLTGVDDFHRRILLVWRHDRDKSTVISRRSGCGPLVAPSLRAELWLTTGGNKPAVRHIIYDEA